MFVDFKKLVYDYDFLLLVIFSRCQPATDTTKKQAIIITKLKFDSSAKKYLDKE